MKKTEISMIVSIFLLIVILSLSPVIAILMSEVSIRSTGRISLIPSVTSNSEIRGVFVHASSLTNPDWDLIAQTCAESSVNVIVVEATGNNWAHYESYVIPFQSEELTPAIQAAHSNGIELWAGMNVLLSAYTGDGIERRAVTSNSDGTNMRYTNWLCPTNPYSRDLIKDIVEEMVANYDIDGFLFDYIRYESREMCFCEYCQAKFKSDTGLTDAVFPQDVLEGRKYGHEFLEWRVGEINDLVHDMRDWILAIKPEMKFSAAVWQWEVGYPTYWRYWIGQDSTYWVNEGWLDWVAPMAYTDNVAGVGDIVDDFNEYQIGGPEGIIPLAPFIDTCVDTISTPSNFRDRVNMLRESGADGWIIWRYGGPGDGVGSNAPDIRNYLSIVNMPNVFSLQNVQVTNTNTQATITWTTTLPTTSKIEYNTSPFFYSTLQYWDAIDFHYWDIDKATVNTLNDSSYVTEHSITITNLTPNTKYYYSIQSKDSSGTVTTKVMTFTTSG